MNLYLIEKKWQCILVCWGTKYSVELINNLINHIVSQSSQAARYILITDEPKQGLVENVEQTIFPEFFNQSVLRTSGCHAKLAMFERGVLPYDLPSIYIDLDTVIAGDVSRALDFLKTPQTVTIFQSALLPLGFLGRTAWRLSNKKYYARGNSSIVVFQPSQCYYIAEQFRAYFLQYPDFSFKPMQADERFISWIAQPYMQAIPNTFAVKFPTEFMFPIRAWLQVRAVLPWVIKRRKNLVAITLNGLTIKPEKLLELKEGDSISDEKNRSFIWSDKTMGISKAKITEFYQTLKQS